MSSQCRLRVERGWLAWIRGARNGANCNRKPMDRIKGGLMEIRWNPKRSQKPARSQTQGEWTTEVVVELRNAGAVRPSRKNRTAAKVVRARSEKRAYRRRQPWATN